MCITYTWHVVPRAEWPRHSITNDLYNISCDFPLLRLHQNNSNLTYHMYYVHVARAPHAERLPHSITSGLYNIYIDLTLLRLNQKISNLTYYMSRQSNAKTDKIKLNQSHIDWLLPINMTVHISLNDILTLKLTDEGSDSWPPTGEWMPPEVHRRVQGSTHGVVGHRNLLLPIPSIFQRFVVPI